MPYRDHTTVQSWVADFLSTYEGGTPDLSVVEQYFTEGPETGLVVVQLRSASTITSVQPTVLDDGVPTWRVHFAARDEGFELDGAGVARLAADLQLVSLLCTYLQTRTDALHAHSEAH